MPPVCRRRIFFKRRLNNADTRRHRLYKAITPRNHSEPDGTDPFTGEKIVEEARKTVDAVVTEISGEDRVLDNGIELVRGDIQFSVDYDLIAADYDAFKAVEYDSKRYVILAADRKGIGQPNRVEFSARKET